MTSILLLGDAHLREVDSELEPFLLFLRQASSRAGALYLLGDLFDLWVGAEAFLSESHRRVVEALRLLRAEGMDLVYVEGNRDYRLRGMYGTDPFREVVETGYNFRFGVRRIHLAHGDLVNREDRPYHLWRRVAKGPWLLGAFNLLPRAGARALARRMERGIARTNRKHRIHFPDEQCRSFAEQLQAEGADTLVLGHFHQETRRTYERGGKKIDVFILPSWRDARRYLRIHEDGRAEFEKFEGGGPCG